MTYLPVKSTTTSTSTPPPAVTALGDADTLSITQSGAARTATLLTLKGYVLGSTGSTGGATGSSGGTTGATSGSTGSTGSTATTGSTGSMGSTGSTASTGSTGTGGTAPAARLGYPASTTAVKNTATAPAAVSVPTAPSRALPAFTQASGESARGKVIDKNNYASDHITLADGTAIGLTASANRAGLFTLTKNGSVINNSRLDLVFGVKNSPITFDDAVQIVYHGNDAEGHNVYVMNDHGLGAQTWFKLEGNGPDLDTEGDDPRVSALVAGAVAPVGDPPYGLGTHPASVGDEPRFTTWINEFNRSVGRPAYVNCFLTYGNNDFSGWGNEAYTAAQSLAGNALGKNVIPVLGMPMALNKNFGAGSNNVDLNNFISGAYDTYITAAVKNYLSFFDRLDVRPGYEANGTFMPWFWGGQNGETVTPPLWVSAFKHIYTVCKAAAASASTDAGRTKTCLVTWNPCHQNYNTGANPRDMYPGDAYCDYIGLDIYSPNYAQDNTNWSGDGQSYAGDKATWSVQKYKNPLNRIKFWDYPAAKNGDPTGGTAGWGLQDSIAFALARGKPLAFPECGAGSNTADSSGGELKDPGIGPCEDEVFPYYLRSRVDQFINGGGTFLYLNIWSADEGDGGWGYLFRQRAKQAIAWSSAFGGTGAALVYGGGGGGGSTGGSASTGGTGATGAAAGGSTGSAATGGTATTGAAATVTDTGGKTATLTLNTYQTYYSSDTGLSVNIFYYLDSATNKPTVGSSADAQVSALVITLNGTNTVASGGLAGVTTYSGSSSSGSTGTGSTAATAKVSDNGGKTATLTLSSYQTFYQNTTGLTLDIYYYLDSATGKPTVGSSADGHVASLLITRNGTATVASGGLAGVTTYA